MGLEIVEFKPRIVALAGAPLSGKTTLGNELSSRTNLCFFETDEIRRQFPAQLYPNPKEERDFFRNPVRRFTAIAVAQAYANHLAAKVLERGKPVLLAATYSHPSYVNPLREFADLYRRVNQLAESALRIFVLEVPEECLIPRVEERVRLRLETTVNTVAHAMDLRRRFMPIEGDDIIHVNTGLPIEENITQILAELTPFRL